MSDSHITVNVLRQTLPKKQPLKAALIDVVFQISNLTELQ